MQESTARDLAEAQVNKEVSEAKGVKGFIFEKIWKGNLAKRYYQKRYEREFLNGKKINLKHLEKDYFLFTM